MWNVAVYGWKLLNSAGIGLDPFASAVRQARFALSRIVGSGTVVPDDISHPILLAAEAVRAGTTTTEIEYAFYAAYSRLAKRVFNKILDEAGAPENPFQDALSDSELLLKYAAETGAELPKEIIEPILIAHTAYRADDVSDAIKASFYGAYGMLAKLFGDITADSIRACSSTDTLRTLRRNRCWAIGITIVIASFSVFTFVADSMSRGILHDIASANTMAAQLRAGLTPSGGVQTISAIYAKTDPCGMLDHEDTDAAARKVRSVSDVQQLQEFAVTIRDLHGRTIKLNWVVANMEDDPFRKNGNPDHDADVPDREALNKKLQLNPAILNYTAEVLCKIKTYQLVRTYATNVQMDYGAIVGAFFSYVLPIFYALLGGFAYRLRLFSETIRRKTYHPSFSDSARMITAVIAGAIAGLFNPAQGAALSPLATAFLVGYGVELFFKFLDTLINAFGSTSVSARRSGS